MNLDNYILKVLSIMQSQNIEKPMSDVIVPLVLARIFGKNDIPNLSKEQKQGISILYQYCNKEDPECSKCPMKKFCIDWRENKGQANYQEPLVFADLFCGAGGLSLGLEHAGFVPGISIDLDRSACKTYLFNRPGITFKSVQNVDLKEIVDNQELAQYPIVVGGPPCQGFSNANRQRLSDDPRNKLYKYFIKYIQKSRARICLVENVPGMLRVQKQVEADFADIGFFIRPYVVCAEQFGYAQYRKRVFWLGIQTNDALLFDKMYNCFTSSIDSQTQIARTEYTLYDTIKDLPILEAKTLKNATHVENEKWGFSLSNIRQFDSDYCQLINNGLTAGFLFNHKSKYNNERDIEIYRRLLPGESSNASSIADIMPYKNRDHIFKDKFYKLEPDRPCKTITAHMYYDCHMYIHPYQARGLTPREAARVQGFPDDYLFLGTPNEWYRQIGNAVSPLVARHIGNALRNVVEELGRGFL